MNTHSPSKRFGLLIAATLLLAGGCATVPEPLEGSFTPITPEQAADQHVGDQVRWGGRIVDTRPGSESTCIEILDQPLDRHARPMASDQAEGRFLACRQGFEDPAIFESGRDITVIGRLTGFVEGRIGEFTYVYPRVAADTLFLWADRPHDLLYRDPRWYHDPWGPYLHYPWYYGPRLRFSSHIVIRR